jgi:hypothetical protein
MMYFLQETIEWGFRLWRKEVGRSLLLGLACWVVLVAAWLCCQEGNLVYRAIAAVLMPGFKAGECIAMHVFGDSSVHRGHLGPLFISVGCELLLLTAAWYFVLRSVRIMRERHL